MDTLDVTKPQKVSYCIPEWLKIEQIKVAIATVKDRIEPCHDLRQEPVAVVGFGPSLRDTWEQVREFKWIITCSGAHRFLIDRGIIQTWHVDVDPRPHKVDLIGTPHPDVEYLMASTCHPRMWDHLAGFKIKLWHIFDNSDDAARFLPRGEWAITGGVDAGLRAITIARFFGFTDLHIFGIDGSAPSPEQGRHADKHPNPVKAICTTEYEGRTFYTTPPMIEAARIIWYELDQLKDVRPTFHGDGLIQHMAKFWKRKADDGKPELIAFLSGALISEDYRALNRRLHRDNLTYGVGGAQHAPVVLKMAEVLQKESKFVSILDYGAGKGLLAREIPFPIAEYDPAIPGKDMLPRPADLVVCFPAGTIVGGSTAFIEKLKEGDNVGSIQGSEQQVVRAISRRYSGDLVKLRVATVPDVEMTANHPVLVSRLRRVHRKCNGSLGKSVYEYVVENTRWEHAKNVARGDWVEVPRLSGDSSPVLCFQKHGNGKQIKEAIVDTETAWLLGLYVAEGFTQYPVGFGGRITLSLGHREDAIAARAVAAFRRIAVRASIHKPKGNTLLVLAGCVGLCRALDAWCGKGAGNKIVPEAIKCAPERIIRSFVDGLVTGDGCLRRFKRSGSTYKYYSVATVSKRLAYGLLELLHKIGVHAYLPNPDERTVGQIQGRNVSMRPCYTVSWSKRSWDHRCNKDGKIPYGRGHYLNGRIYLPVKDSTVRKVRDLAVFNLETEDHTYGVPYSVHNCTDVLEHIEPDKLNAVLTDLRRCVRRYGYFVICTAPASKHLADGRNTHLIIKDEAWWRKELSKHFVVRDDSIVRRPPWVHFVVSPLPTKQPKSVAEETLALA